MSDPASRFGPTSIISVCLLIAGCVDWSGDVPRYRKLLDGGHPQAIAPFDPSADLSVQRALLLANADNEAIASSGEQWVQALAEKMRAAGTFMPTLSISPEYSLTHSRGSVFLITTPTGGVATTAVGANLSHEASIPLDASLNGSLSNASTYTAAGQTAQQQEQLLLDERETILLQVAQSYYAVLKAQRQAAVYEHGVAVKMEKVRDQEARLKLGNVRPLDLAQSQADLATTRASLTQAHIDSANARSALARLMGVSAVNGRLIDGFDPPPQLSSLEQSRAWAEAHRQDLLAARRAVESARSTLEAAIREYFPSVSINFSYFLYNDPANAVDWVGGISANVPIFSALSIEADIRRGWSAYRQSELAQSQTLRQVIDDVNENYESLQGSRDKVVDLTVAVDSAQTASDLAERAYQLGSDSNLDRLTQQDNLLTAQLNLVSEQYNGKTSYLGLLRAEGALWTLLPGQQR
jgi:outer membrane protein